MAASALLSSYLPVQVFTLDVKPGEIVACIEAPSAFRVTMAALDPTAPALPFPENPDAPPRATLKLIRHNTPLDLDDFSSDDDDDEEDEDGSDVDAIERRLGLLDDEAESESDEEENGGPSDPEKVKKARLEAVVKQLANGIVSDEDEEDVEMTNGVNGTKVKKGKMKVTDADELDDDEDDDDDGEDDEDDDEDEAFVVCTLDTMHHYQQPLDLSITHPDAVSFQNVGTHTIYLTGNYFDGPVDDDDDDEDEESDEDDDDEDEEENIAFQKSMKALLAGLDEEDSDSNEEDEESDELDDLDDPRIKELDSDEEEEAPKLVKATGKGKNKRPAESDDEEVENLDDLIKKTLKDEVPKTNGEQKLSKKQLKKLKKNDGQAAPGAEQAVPQKKEESKVKVEEEKKSAIKDSPGNGNGKKVQFAKNLEQGPTGSPKVDVKADNKKEPDEKGVKVVQGVTIDDRKTGTGAAAKKGDRVSMRYIGKLDKDNKVFDSNKRGKPFGFKLGSGEVIKGWDIGVAGMKVGGERRLTIPASLAYGSKSMPGIPGNSTLKFDIKLLSIN